MLNILLVEDEIFMRKGLIKLIDWNQYGFNICAEASNGLEALDILKKVRCDLIITDIKMPVMDGIELIANIVENFDTRPAIIIISGYNEFEFAKAAIRYGVNDYLLKPIDEKELVQSLLKLKNKIENEREFTKRKFIFEYLKRNTKFVRKIDQDEMSDIISNDHDESVWVGIGKREDLQYVDDLEIAEILLELEKQITSKFASKLINFECYWDSLVNLIFIIRMDQKQRKEGIVKQILSFVENQINLRLILYERLDKATFLSSWYRTLIKKLNFAQFYEITGIHNVDEIGNFELSIEEKKLTSELISCIEGRNSEQMRNHLLQFFQECHLKKISPEIIKGYILLVLLEVIDYFEAYQLFETDSLKFIYKSNLQRSKFIENVIDVLSQIMDHINNASKQNGPAFIKRIEMFIKENYNKELTIKSIAQQFYINPIYLGRIFKKHFNMSFNKYLHMLRIEQAKKLLMKTDMKIYEIAKEVGYNDTDYFSLKFEEYVGKSPSKFRSSLLEG